MNKRQTIIGLFVVASLSGCYYDNEESLYPKPIVAEVKWSTNIKPIIDVNCATQFCHGAIAISPDLTTYEKVFASKDRIKERAIIKKDMPPSGALSQSQIDALTKWLDAGAPNN